MVDVPKAEFPDPGARALAILLIFAQVGVSILAGYFVLMQTFSVAGCGSRCDFTLVSVAVRGTLAIAIIALVTSVAVVIVRSRQGRSSWWAPVAAMALMVATGAVATALVIVGTDY